MNPVLLDIYSTVIPAAPYIIAAYVLFWVILLIYVVIVVKGLKSTESQVALLEDRIDRIEDAHIDVGVEREEG